VPEVLG
jgi:hypothetical protein